MQRKDSNVDTQKIRKKSNTKSNGKKKRSITVEEKSDLIEYYQNQKVSEYSQTSLQPQDQEEIPEKNKILPLLKRNESPKKLIVSKVQLNAKLKKQLNLLGIGEEQDIQENAQSTNEFVQRPFSSKYVMRQSKDKYHNLIRNNYEIKDSKSTSRIYHCHQQQFQMDNSALVYPEQARMNPFPLRGQTTFATSNTLFLSNSFAKRENFVLTRGSTTTTRYGQDQNLCINNQHQEGQKSSSSNIRKSFMLNSEMNSSFELFKSKGGDTNKSTCYQSKDLLPLQFSSQSTYQEEGVDKIIGNAIQLRQKDDCQKVQIKVKDDNLSSSNLLNLPIHHTKRMSCSPIINNIEKRPKSITNINNTTQQIQNNDYIKFQNQLLNILLPQPTQEEKLDIEMQKEKEGLLKYFNFPKSLNLQENQMNKLEQSKLVFQAYLSYRSPKFVAEKMKDQSLLQVLQKVKSQYVNNHPNRLTKNQFYSKNNSPTNKQDFLKESLKDQGSKENLSNQDSLKQNQKDDENQVNFFNKEQLPKQPNLLSELVNQLIDKQQSVLLENSIDQGDGNHIIQDSYQSHFLFNRSKSVDRGSLVKQMKRDQFNNQFNLEMMKLRTKERRLQLNDQKILPATDITQDHLLLNQSNVDNLSDPFKIPINKQKESHQNSHKKSSSTSRQINKYRKQYFHQINDNQGESNNLPSLDNKQNKLSTRIPTPYNDAHLNDEVNKQQEEQDHYENCLDSLIDSLNSEYLFSDKSKENINHPQIINQKKKSSSKKRKTNKILNDISKLLIVNNKYKKKHDSPNHQEKHEMMNNSFDSYQPSNNHLTQKMYQKSKKYFKKDYITESKLVQQSHSKSPKQKEFELKIDPDYLNEQNQKYMILRRLIKNKQYEIQMQN